MSLVLLAVFAVRPTQQSLNDSAPRIVDGQAGSLLNPAKPLPPFNLIDHTGAGFTNARLSGKWTLLFMGFASCGHYCPPTMYKLGLVAEQFDPALQVLFVSVDPGRDTQEVLYDYITAYGENFVAVTGDEQALGVLVGGLGATSRVTADPDNYVVDHSPAVFLINPEGGFAGLFTPPHSSDAIVADIRFQMERFARD